VVRLLILPQALSNRVVLDGDNTGAISEQRLSIVVIVAESVVRVNA
jgi:hypothetical protein